MNIQINIKYTWWCYTKGRIMNSRIKFIDYSKGLGILFVVFGHVYCASNIVTNWIYSFHMPLFFIISGFLLNFEYRYKTIIFKKI